MWGLLAEFKGFNQSERNTPFSPAGPHISRELLESTSFQKSSFWCSSEECLLSLFLSLPLKGALGWLLAAFTIILA
jgi:hypothetical protein